MVAPCSGSFESAVFNGIQHLKGQSIQAGAGNKADCITFEWRKMGGQTQIVNGNDAFQALRASIGEQASTANQKPIIAKLGQAIDNGEIGAERIVNETKDAKGNPVSSEIWVFNAGIDF